MKRMQFFSEIDRRYKIATASNQQRCVASDLAPGVPGDLVQHWVVLHYKNCPPTICTQA